MSKNLSLDIRGPIQKVIEWFFLFIPKWSLYKNKNELNFHGNLTDCQKSK